MSSKPWPKPFWFIWFKKTKVHALVYNIFRPHENHIITGLDKPNQKIEILTFWISKYPNFKKVKLLNHKPINQKIFPKYPIKP